MLRCAALLVTAGWIVAMASCGSGGATSAHGSAGGGNQANHVVLVVLENANYAEVVGSADASYLNSLLTEGALATNYYANVHPSIGDYFMLTTGAMASTYDAYAGTVGPPEIVSALTGAGKSWKVYAEGIPAAGYTGGDTGTYLKRHDPLAYFTDVAGTAAAGNIVPFSQLATDVNGTLPDFVMIVGDIYDVGHNCLPTVVSCTAAIRVQQADAWLRTTLPMILSNASFQTSGLLAVTFDESDTDNTNGGGQVATVLLGTNVKSGYKAVGLYQHQSLLRLMLEAQGVSSLPNGAAGAASMGEVWK